MINWWKVRWIWHEQIDCTLGPAYAHFVPKTHLNEHFKALVERFKENKKDFLRKFITFDEMWINHYTPETKKRVAKCKSATKKTMIVSSTGKLRPSARVEFQHQTPLTDLHSDATRRTRPTKDHIASPSRTERQRLDAPIFDPWHKPAPSVRYP